MDFIKLYKKKIKKREQKEDYLTELIAFICRISGKFKEFYIKEFLNLEVSDISSVRIETQVRSSDEKTKVNIPDFIIYDREEIICICEHKIDSDINTKEGGENQLDKYYRDYKNKGCKYFIIIKPEFKILKNFRNKHKNKNWEEKNWQKLFISLKENYKIKDFFEYNNFEEFSKEKPNFTTKLVYFLMELLDEFEQSDFDWSDYSTEYGSVQELLDKANESIRKFYLYRKILKELKGNKRGGSELNDFIENSRIYINVENVTDEYEYYGFYGWFKDFYLQKWKGGNSEPFDLNDKNILKIKDKYCMNLSSAENRDNFNEDYDKTLKHLKKFNMFFSKIIKQVKFKLEGKSIIIDDRSKIKSEDNPTSIYYESKIKDVPIYFGVSEKVSEKEILLWFDKLKLNQQISKITTPFEEYKEDTDLGYFKRDVYNLKFTDENIKQIIKFYTDNITEIYNVIKR